ncbi:MAG TPA: cell division protein ZapA [Terriglobia bacterium]|nr:cell division protein ZapA [Terriglobia bacterium]
MATPSQDGIRVSIYDQEYNMRGDLDPEYIQRLARFVDEKMRSIASRTHTVDSLRTAVLAALNIADEYHQMIAKYEAATRDVDQKVDACNQVLDRLLSSSE